MMAYYKDESVFMERAKVDEMMEIINRQKEEIHAL